MGLVLGCSVVLAWHFDDESTPAADGVLDRVTAGGAVVPALWHLEVANALRAASRRRRITLDYRDFVRAGLRRFDVAVDEETGAKAWTATLTLSVRLGLTPYDARPMSNSPSAEAAAREPRPGDAGRGCDLGAGTPGRRALTRRTGGLPRPRRGAICAGMSGSPPAAADPLGWHGTTILSVRKAGLVAMAGDGQVSLGQTVVKGNARKVRRIAQGRVLAGFAGATADAFTLLERLESKLERFPDQLERACVELAKDWRSDRYLRRLEALMAVADGERSFILTGQGDVLEPEDQIIGIGSGGNYALAAARALATVDGLSAEEVCCRAMRIAGEICVYTNDRVVLETLESRR